MKEYVNIQLWDETSESVQLRAPAAGTPVVLGFRSGLHAVENKKKILRFDRESNPDRATRSMSLYWLSYL